MQVWCYPRWKEDNLISFHCRPHVSSNEPQVILTLQDRVLAWLRSFRIDILSRKMLIMNENLHEPHYLLDLFRQELDTRLDPTDDVTINSLQNAYPKTHQQLRIEFYHHYTIYSILDSLLKHIRVQQIQTRTSKDPLDLAPLEIQDLLVQKFGTKWKQEEYDELPDTIRGMVTAQADNDEIVEFLEHYGFSWQPEEDVESACIRLMTTINIYSRSANHPDVVRVQVIQAQLEGKSRDQKRQILLDNDLLMRGQKLDDLLTAKAVKEVQISHFLSSEVYDNENRFTRKAAFLLLKACGVLGGSE